MCKCVPFVPFVTLTSLTSNPLTASLKRNRISYIPLVVPSTLSVISTVGFTVSAAADEIVIACVLLYYFLLHLLLLLLLYKFHLRSESKTPFKSPYEDESVVCLQHLNYYF